MAPGTDGGGFPLPPSLHTKISLTCLDRLEDRKRETTALYWSQFSRELRPSVIRGSFLPSHATPSARARPGARRTDAARVVIGWLEGPGNKHE